MEKIAFDQSSVSPYTPKNFETLRAMLDTDSMGVPLHAVARLGEKT